MDIKANIDLLIAAATLAGLLSTAMMWYRTKVEKTYAAQRDFNHLRNSINGLSTSIDKLIDEQDEAINDLKREISSLNTKLETLPFSGYRTRRDWTSFNPEDPPTSPM